MTNETKTTVLNYWKATVESTPNSCRMAVRSASLPEREGCPMTNETQPFDQWGHMEMKFPADPIPEGTAEELQRAMLRNLMGLHPDVVQEELADRRGLPVVGDDELYRIWCRGYDTHEGHTYLENQPEMSPPIMAGIRAVREALAAQAVQVPELSDEALQWLIARAEAVIGRRVDPVMSGGSILKVTPYVLARAFVIEFLKDLPQAEENGAYIADQAEGGHGE